jgi:hypothetical protein
VLSAPVIETSAQLSSDIRVNGRRDDAAGWRGGKVNVGMEISCIRRFIRNNIFNVKRADWQCNLFTENGAQKA